MTTRVPSSDPSLPIIPEALEADRERTDAALRVERSTTDELLGTHTPGNNLDEVIDAKLGQGEERLEELRQQVDAHLERQAEVLPEMSRTLEHVASALTEAATSLTNVAETLSEPRSAVEPVKRIADVASGIAEVAADLDAERQGVDDKLGKERRLTDHLVREQAEVAQAVIAEDLKVGRGVLADERRATDADLERERRHTDAAVERVQNLCREQRQTHNTAAQEYVTRNEFLEIVSHDLKVPLATISAAATLIGRVARTGSEALIVRSAVERIHRAETTMEKLISNLLDFAGFAEGRLQLVCREVDLGDVVARAVDMVLPLAAAQSISLATELAAGSVCAICDSDRVLQVITNLLQNAIKFTAERGAIRVSVTRADGGWWCVSVTDTGIGIPPTELDSIFERFKRLRSDRQGLGLGLYIARSIVEAHGGRIWAESEPGVGSTLRFTLPAAPASDEHGQEPS